MAFSAANLTGQVTRPLAQPTSRVLDGGFTVGGTPLVAIPVVFVSLTNLTNEGGEVYAATSSGTSTSAQGQIAEASLAGVVAWIEGQKPVTGDGSMVLAFDALRTQQAYGFNDFIVQVSTAGLVSYGVNTGTLTSTGYTLPEGAGSRTRLHRSAANVITVQTTVDNGVIWTVRHTFVATPTTTLRAHIYTTYSTTPRRLYQIRQAGLVFDILGARFAADGNSQTVGINGAPLSYPGRIATTLAVTVTNYAVGGQSTLDMIADAAAEIDAAFAGANILIVGEVRNHLVAMDLAANARDAVDSFWTYCDGRKAAATAAGKALRIVAWNILPAGHTSSAIGITALNALFVAANALMAAEWEAHVDAFVDVRSDVRLTDCFDLTYFDDDVHLTAAGDDVMKDLLNPAILALT